ncbi:unnamed protein product [Ectocarpus sp. CCAP 1310/34]|nr:unnamed protein product [Ectocarpus sp. CCAP 1310/34]
MELEKEKGKSMYFPRCGSLYVQNGFRTHTKHAYAAIAPGNAEASTTPVDINDFHCVRGHSQEVLLGTTAKQQGTTLVGELRECLGCSTGKGLSKPIPNKTSTRASLLPIAEEEEEFATDKDEVGEGASSQGGGRTKGEPMDGGPAPAAPPAAPQESGAGDADDGAPSSREGASVAPSTTSAGMADGGDGEVDRRRSSSRRSGGGGGSDSGSNSGSDSDSETDLPALCGPEAWRLARFDKPAEFTSRCTRENPRRNPSTEEFTSWMLSAVLHVAEGLEAREVRELLFEGAGEAHAARQEAEDFLLDTVDLMLNSPDAFETALASHELSESPTGPKRDDEKGGEWPVREAIGSMMWVSTFSRPDVSFSVRAVARHAHAPAKRHWGAIQKILGYLKETRDLGITSQRGSGLGLAVYVDASYADTEDKRSVSGLATTVGAEYIAAGEGVKEALFVRAVLSFVAPETSGSSIQVLDDNQGAIALVQKPHSSGRTKHIDVRFHFIRALFRSGGTSVKFVPTTEQHADLLTKVLSRASLQYHRRKLMNFPE